MLLNVVVNMESLPRSSETAEQRPISERTRSQRRRSVETNEQTAARLSAQRAMRVVSVETLEQAYRRRAANRCRSQRLHRRNLTAHVDRAVSMMTVRCYRYEFIIIMFYYKLPSNSNNYALLLL